MLNNDLLINKGFELNDYGKDGKYYELVETEETKVEKILKASHVGYDPEHIDDKVILQINEDFNKKIICVNCDVWELDDSDIVEILDVL